MCHRAVTTAGSCSPQVQIVHVQYYLKSIWHSPQSSCVVKKALPTDLRLTERPVRPMAVLVSEAACRPYLRVLVDLVPGVPTGSIFHRNRAGRPEELQILQGPELHGYVLTFSDENQRPSVTRQCSS
ncbi:unnamed protein product [Pleuronectes platessa]|uniref:Uncharacterized protein n=1 Tax=Pleuronectes platessa TaxID=8262 RepID=A0A9N7U398_PLEPL|nr:unnamed protein product [Pleuronectes platessa]